MKQKKINENKKATRIVYICDQGHYGSTTCSLCQADISGYPDKCPSCGATLVDSNISTNTGGSDF